MPYQTFPMKVVGSALQSWLAYLFPQILSPLSGRRGGWGAGGWSDRERPRRYPCRFRHTVQVQP